MFKRHYLYVLLITLSISATGLNAEEAEGDDRRSVLTDFEATKQAQKEIELIESIEPQNFPRQLRDARNAIDQFFEHKKRVCNGEFSTVILNPVELTGGELTEEEIVVRRLNADERQMCFREMREMQSVYINNVFKARKAYLDFVHEQRIKEMNQARIQALEDLNTSFSR